MTETKPIMPIGAFTMWLAQGERGLSSEAIVTHLTGIPISGRPWSGVHHPHDPSDFRRCELLLRQVPMARLCFDQMRTASPTWARLVDAWDELVALSEEEVPGAFEGKNGPAPRTYARMRELRDAA